MQPLRAYDDLVIARERVFALVTEAAADAWYREFSVGPGSIARTLTHVMVAAWYSIEGLLEHTVPASETWPIRDEVPPPLDVLKEEWSRQATRTRAAIESISHWSAVCTYEVEIDGGGRHLVMPTRSDIVTQLVLHDVHHLAQVLNMLRQLAIAIPDLDFNTLMYPRSAPGIR